MKLIGKTLTELLSLIEKKQISEEETTNYFLKRALKYNRKLNVFIILPNKIKYLQKGVLKGIPCSGGIVQGTARVIRDIFDADRLREGDILITKFTDPGWTPKFSLLKGVATETGGILSHAAVIAREYGIPAVLAVPHLIQMVPDGAEIVLDGDTGVVKVLLRCRSPRGRSPIAPVPAPPMVPA